MTEPVLAGRSWLSVKDRMHQKYDMLRFVTIATLMMTDCLGILSDQRKRGG